MFVGIAKLLILVACVAAYQPKSQVDERIVGGVAINITDAPWQISLRYRGSHICGGSIISSQWILTAGHCTAHYASAVDLTVRIGSSFYKDGGEVFKLKRFIIHPKYNDIRIDYDFSLLELEEPITLNDAKQAIQLHEKEETFADNTKCVVSGWGITQNGNESNLQLRRVEVPIVNQRKCFRSYLIFFKRITARMICAGYYGKGGKDACQGDSGGPLSTPSKKDGKPTLIGIVSFGIGCATRLFPGVYSRVTFARDWISAETGI